MNKINGEDDATLTLVTFLHTLTLMSISEGKCMRLETFDDIAPGGTHVSR
ncbi:MAG: hypothetical protein QXK93_06260 [Candidatus Bathyarchaeia archaeon]